MAKGRTVSAREMAEQEARARLLEWLKPGDTVYTVLRHVSKSGMMRRISLFVLQVEDGEARPICLDYNAARLLGWSLRDREEGIVVNGCGMDMGFHLVYSLSSALFRGADGIEQYREGYALNQRWL